MAHCKQRISCQLDLGAPLGEVCNGSPKTVNFSTVSIYCAKVMRGIALLGLMNVF